MQRGFVPLRQLIENILILDTSARWFGMRNREAILAFFDFAAAFPSVAHAWLMSVLEAIGAPLGIINLVRAMYHLNSNYIIIDCETQFLYYILAGVLQGCPLSGMLFDIAIDPLLAMFEEIIQHPGKADFGVCADDVGAAMEWNRIGISHSSTMYTRQQKKCRASH